MCTYSLSHLPDPVLLRDLAALVARERATTAALLAHLAEVDARRLYLPAAHPSMFSYCVHELRLSEDAAYKRIQAARAARQFPALFIAVAEGRLHLAAVCLLAPHLTPDNVQELLAAVAYRSKAEIERLLAERFPRPDLPAVVRAIPAGPPLPDCQLAPGQVAADTLEGAGAVRAQLAPGQVEAPAPRPTLAPLAPQRFALQVTLGQGTHDKLCYIRALLGHQLPTGDLAHVLDRAFDAYIGQLEQRRFAATSRPRPRRGQRRSTANPRHIPAEVKRTVWERDGGQCTFASDIRHRCPARTRLEFDHADPVARGGEATAENLRLRCRAHNQYGAERSFGVGFMHQKRQEARNAAAARRRAAEARAGRGGGDSLAAAARVARRRGAPRGGALREHSERPARGAGAGGAVRLRETSPRPSREDRADGDVTRPSGSRERREACPWPLRRNRLRPKRLPCPNVMARSRAVGVWS